MKKIKKRLPEKGEGFLWTDSESRKNKRMNSKLGKRTKPNQNKT